MWRRAMVLEWKERQKTRIQGLRSRLLLWRLSPESMRDELENIDMLLFRFVGNGFHLALCNVSWLATRESVVLVPGPIVFASWSMLLDRGEPCDSCQDTPHEAASACFLSRASEEWPVTQKKLAPSVHGVCWEKVKMIQESLSHALSQVHCKGDLGDDVDGMKGDTVKFLSDDADRTKRGAPDVCC